MDNCPIEWQVRGHKTPYRKRQSHVWAICVQSCWISDPRQGAKVHISYQSRHGLQVLPASIGPYLLKGMTAYLIPYLNLLQRRSWAALPPAALYYIIQPFWLPSLLVYPLPSWSPGSPLSFPLLLTWPAQGHAHSGLSQMLLEAEAPPFTHNKPSPPPRSIPRFSFDFFFAFI